MPALEALLSDSRVHVCLVVTQPDRPAGRGRKLSSPPVKEVAVEHGIGVYQPESLRSAQDRESIAASRADLFVVAAFGKIFGPKLLSLPTIGAVNLHASLLPQFRGASPISAAIMEGCPETGVTLMRMDTGLDTGPILARRSILLDPGATTASVTPQLAQIGAELLIDSLEGLQSNSIAAVPQDDDCATLTRPMTKADGWIDWNRKAIELERHVRALWDWPRAWTTLRGQPVQIHRASIGPTAGTAPPGMIEQHDGMPAVMTGEGMLFLDVVQNAGSAPLTGSAWMQRSDAIGVTLGETGAPTSPEYPLVRNPSS